jgi:hypothetical protein
MTIREVRGLISQGGTIDVRLICQPAEQVGGLDLSRLRVGEVVTLPRDQAHTLIAQGLAMACPDERLQAQAADACSPAVATPLVPAPSIINHTSATRRRQTARSSLSVSVPDEWACVTNSRLNTLVIGPRRVTAGLVNSLRSRMLLPIVQILPDTPLALPLAAPVGTVVLHDVDRLDRSGQLYLLGWLDLSVARPRVISTSSASLLPSVEAGAFLAALYYRLNLLCVRC